MKKEKIDWDKLKRFKESISIYKKKYGTQSAIDFSTGVLGLRRGELVKHRPRIRKIVKRY